MSTSARQHVHKDNDNILMFSRYATYCVHCLTFMRQPANGHRTRSRAQPVRLHEVLQGLDFNQSVVLIWSWRQRKGQSEYSKNLRETSQPSKKSYEDIFINNVNVKPQSETTGNGIFHPGNLNVCGRFRANPSISCWDIWLKKIIAT